MFTSLFQLEKKPVTVFSSSDTDAPTLTTDAGSLKTLLKACLVTGYGDKQGLGWQMVFESEDMSTAVFKSADPTASGYCLKVDNSSSNVKLSAYQSMTDIDTGVKPIVENQLYEMQTCNWKLVGHGKAFVLLLDYMLDYFKVRTAYPLLFGDLPRQTKRIVPVCVLWNGRKNSNYQASGGVQSTLFYRTEGYSSGNSTGRSSAVNYGFVVNDGQAGAYLNKNYCRFNYDNSANASVLYEPVLCNLPDSTWTLLPMLQPLSTRLSDVGNLGLITESTIKAVTGHYDYNNTDNLDCAVPIDWWYA